MPASLDEPITLPDLPRPEPLYPDHGNSPRPVAPPPGPVEGRKVEGGWVSAEAYPDAGEPDWRAECERLRAQVEAWQQHAQELEDAHLLALERHRSRDVTETRSMRAPEVVEFGEWLVD